MYNVQFSLAVLMGETICRKCELSQNLSKMGALLCKIADFALIFYFPYVIMIT